MKNYLLLVFIGFLSLTINAQTLSGKHHIKYLEINTVQSDYGTTYLEENKVVFTAPASDKKKNPQLDLFVGDIGEEGEITNKERVKGLIGKKISKTGITYSQDKQTVYFSAKPYRSRPRSKDKAQLFMANVETSGEWTEITKLPFNGKNFSCEQPSLNKDNTKLYFVSDMPGSIGGKDIFVVNISNDGSFGAPKNLGNKINTPKDEVTPYITEKDILYFSSNGHEEGLGSLDVYASEIFENTVSDPLHLESPVNSMNDDFAYIVNSKNDRGFFSSNRLQGQSNNDIYAFTIEEQVPVKCVQEIAGIVRDKNTMEVLKDAAITLFDNDGNQVQQVVTDSEGAYKLTLDCSNTYTLVAASLHYNKEEHVVNTANYVNAPTLEADKFLIKKTDDTVVAEEDNTTEITAPTTMNAIYFDFDRSDIRVDATPELDKIVNIMKENTKIKIEVAAFTDSRGRAAYNLKLSDRRAKATIDYMVSKGVERSRLVAKGYGETRLLNTCINGATCSEADHAINRRTEFSILNTQAYKAPLKSQKEPAGSIKNEELTKKQAKENIALNVAKHLDIEQSQAVDATELEKTSDNSLKKTLVGKTTEANALASTAVLKEDKKQESEANAKMQKTTDKDSLLKASKKTTTTSFKKEQKTTNVAITASESVKEFDTKGQEKKSHLTT